MTSLLLLIALSTSTPVGAFAPSAGEEREVVDPTSFVADRIITLEGGIETYFFRRAGHGTVALRLSVSFGEGPDEAGAGQLIRSLAERRMAAMARRIGARTRVLRTSEALVYEVAGPASEIDFLVWILNEGLGAPEVDRFAETRRDQLAEVRRRQETPQGVLALRLREAAGGGAVPIHGSTVALERMHAGVPNAAHARTHVRSRARLVAVGDVEFEVVLAALTDLQLAETPAGPLFPPGSPVADTRPRPEVIRHWVAEAWTMDRPRDARLLVLVGIAGDRLRDVGGDYELGTEVWEVDGRWTLVVSGAAYPRSQQAMRGRLRGMLGEITGALSDDEVARHASRVRGEILLQASTPWGLADVVGHAVDAGAGIASVAGVLEELEAMTAGDVRGLLDELGARTPIREEVRP